MDQLTDSINQCKTHIPVHDLTIWEYIIYIYGFTTCDNIQIEVSTYNVPPEIEGDRHFFIGFQLDVPALGQCWEYCTIRSVANLFIMQILTMIGQIARVCSIQ